MKLIPETRRAQISTFLFSSRGAQSDTYFSEIQKYGKRHRWHHRHS